MQRDHRRESARGACLGRAGCYEQAVSLLESLEVYGVLLYTGGRPAEWVDYMGREGAFSVARRRLAGVNNGHDGEYRVLGVVYVNEFI